MIEKPCMSYRIGEELRVAVTGSRCRPFPQNNLNAQDYKQVAFLYPLLTSFLEKGKRALELKGYKQIRSTGSLMLETPLTESITLKIVTPNRDYTSAKTDKITLPLNSGPASVIIGRESFSLGLYDIFGIENPLLGDVGFCDVPFYVNKIVRRSLKEYAGEDNPSRLAHVIEGLGMQSQKEDLPQFGMFVHFGTKNVSKLHSALIFEQDGKGTYCSVKSLGMYPVYTGHQGDEGVIGLAGRCGLISITTS